MVASRQTGAESIIHSRPVSLLGQHPALYALKSCRTINLELAIPGNVNANSEHRGSQLLAQTTTQARVSGDLCASLLTALSSPQRRTQDA